MSCHLKLNLLTPFPKAHYLIHELHPPDHHSLHPKKRASYGTPCLLLPFLNPTTCPLSNLKPIDLIFPLVLLSFHFLPLLGLCLRRQGLSPTQLAKKRGNGIAITFYRKQIISPESASVAMSYDQGFAW